MLKDHIFDYQIGADSFVKRARMLIERFDNGEPACLFYAALELRMGIESRLLHYIESALSAAKQPKEKIKEYRPDRLLPKLERINPETRDHVELIMMFEQGGNAVALEYAPVTPILAKYYGALGALLHSTFFTCKSYWYMKRKSTSSGRRDTMLDYRDFLITVSDELEKACRGLLGTPPVFFLEQIDQLNSEPDAER